MPAGVVAVPTVVPLKRSVVGRWNHVDTATKIELKSETNETLVFYTVDGKQPAPFQRLGENHTHLYSGPFTLPPGKVTVKAKAVSKDGSRESSTVTKTFRVDVAIEEEEEEEEEEAAVRSPRSHPLSLSAQLRSQLKLNKTQQTAPPPPSSPDKQRNSTSPLPRSASAPLAPATGTISTTLTHPPPPPPQPRPQPQCTYCQAPFSRGSRDQYCTQCGASLPSLPKRVTRPPAQMSTCPGCGAQVQPDVRECPACETAVLRPPTPPPIRGQATEPSQQGAIICSNCGTRNLTTSHSCITCDASLQHPSPPSSPCDSFPSPPLATPVVPVSGQSYIMCGQCGRVNVSDARFCDWCGCKPRGSQLSVLCSECHTTVNWHAHHCSSCGAFVKAPLRAGVEVQSTMMMPSSAELGRDSWVPVVDIEEKEIETRNQFTQTDRFYPSARTLSNKETVVKQQALQTAAVKRVQDPWKRQVELICSRVRTSLGSSDLQERIGHQRIGKVVSSEVSTGEGVVEIRLQFALKETEAAYESNGHTSKAPRVTATRKVVAVRQARDSVGSREKERVRRKPSESALPAWIQQQQQLLAELSAGGQGREAVVQELLQKGVDVNTTDSSGTPLLSLAAAGGHLNCINVLLESGASVNAQAKRTKNTALHEAVQSGPSAVSCIETLLKHGASAGLCNRNGETPCQLASRLGYSDLVLCFTAHESKRLMSSLSAHPKSTL